MPRKQDWKDQLRIYGPAALLVLIAFSVAYQFIKPAPPDRVVMAAGEIGGAYYEFARRYQAYLAAEGIELEILTTAGSLANLQQLRSGEADIGFLQGGVAEIGADEQLEGLASLYFEPLWLFHRRGAGLDRLKALRNQRVAIGVEGSGTRALVERLLADNGLTGGYEDMAMGGEAAAAALREGRIDAAFFVAAATAPLVKDLLVAPGIHPASFERADAYQRRYRYLSRLTLPEGAMDLENNIPERNIELLAPAATLVASPDLHPALVDLLLLAARNVHGAGGWFEDADRFPSAEYLELPLNAEAERFFQHGPPFLQRYLPFWAASLIDRLKVMLLPLVVLLIPMLKIMPPIYTWRMRSRIYRWYRELEEVDDLLGVDGDTAQRQSAGEELDRIEREVRHISVPASFAGQLYHLRQHVEWVRRRV